MSSYTLGWELPPFKGDPSKRSEYWDQSLLREIGKKHNIGFDIAGIGFSMIAQARARNITLDQMYNEELPGYIEWDDPQNLLNAYNFAKMWVASPYDPMLPPPAPDTSLRDEIDRQSRIVEEMKAAHAAQLAEMEKSRVAQDVQYSALRSAQQAQDELLQKTLAQNAELANRQPEVIEKETIPKGLIPALIAGAVALFALKG